MNKEERQRMAYQTFVEEGLLYEDGSVEAAETTWTVQVSGQRVELHQQWDSPFDNEDGSGPDEEHKTWVMSLDTLKKLIASAQWCIQKSEAFEKAHPLEATQ